MLHRVSGRGLGASPTHSQRLAHISADDRCSLGDGTQGASCKGFTFLLNFFDFSFIFFYRIGFIFPNCAPVHMAATRLNPMLYFLI